MPRTLIGRIFALLALFALILAGPAHAQPMPAPAPSPAAILEYKKKLALYDKAREAFEIEATAYWDAIAGKRRTRNAKRRNGEPVLLEDYVLAQPPVYRGPPRPIDPARPEEKPPPARYVPVIADMLQAAAEHYDFAPTRPESEIEFKRAYAKTARAAGLTRDQTVRVYAFEVGGNGRHDLQSGTASGRAISTALGYNQLLATNTVHMLAEQGDHFVATLSHRAAAMDGPARKALERKIGILRRMIAVARTVPATWNEYDRFANNVPQGFGMHAMTLDIDVGPLLQTQKLLNSIRFARMKGHRAPLTAAELEMMNLTGDGNGFDIVTMPQALREQVPTSNFFLRGGYERNPVAARNNVVAKLIAATDAKMDRETAQPGAKELAAVYDR